MALHFLKSPQFNKRKMIGTDKPTGGMFLFFWVPFFVPIEGVVLDVFYNSFKFFLIPYDIIIIIPLPYMKHIGILSHPFGNTNFKSPDNGTNCHGW